MQTALTFAFLLIAAAGPASGQLSPPAQATTTVGGKTLTINYSAPSVHGRTLFGAGGVISRDPTYPVWRAGANAATSFTTGANLDVGGLKVPKGSYTLFVLVENPDAWQLIINKQTEQWGLTYDQSRDLGRVKMKMSKPPATVEVFRITLADEGGYTAKLTIEWENHIASVAIKVQ
jgi:Protein of unknown function (DUF2911)